MLACREMLLLLGECGEQPRHLVHVPLIIQHLERQRPHAAATRGLLGRLQHELDGGVIAREADIGAAGEDLDRADPIPQVHNNNNNNDTP